MFMLAQQRPCWYLIPHVCEGPSSYQEEGQRKDRMSANRDSRGGTFGSDQRNRLAFLSPRIGGRGSYALVLKTLYDSKSPWIMDILHHKPINCLLVFAVDTSSFNQLGLNAFDGIWLVVCVQMDSESVDHGESC